MDRIQYRPRLRNELPVFNGRIIDKMSELVARGYMPISVAGIMDLRNDAFKSGENEWIQQVCYNRFDSGDGIVYHPDGRIKVVWDSPNLKSLTSNSKLDNFTGWSSLNLEKEKGTKRFEELPEEMKGVQLVFDPKEIKEFTGKDLREEQVPNNKFWLALARGDENRLGTYVQNVYSEINDSELMRVIVIDKKPDFEAERLWCLSGLGYNSNVDGDDGSPLDFDDGRLIGVTPKVQVKGFTTPISTSMNLETLMEDISQAREDGIITPALEKIFKKYNL